MALRTRGVLHQLSAAEIAAAVLVGQHLHQIELAPVTRLPLSVTPIQALRRNIWGNLNTVCHNLGTKNKKKFNISQTRGSGFAGKK
jgi:hypothetical protein